MSNLEAKNTYWVPPFEVLKEFILNVPTKTKSKTIRIKSNNALLTKKYNVGDTLYVKESFVIVSAIEEQFILYKVDNKTLPVVKDTAILKMKVMEGKKSVKIIESLERCFSFEPAIIMNKELVRFKFKILRSKIITDENFHGYELEIIKQK